MNRKNNLLAKISFNINFIVIYCLLFLAVWIYSFIFYPRITASINNPENTLFFNRIISLLGENYILQGIIALGLTILAGTFAFLLNERFSFSPKQSYFPFFFFTLFIAITKKSLFITPGLIAVIFFIFGIYLFFKTYQNKDSVIALNLFLTLSIGSLFFFDLLYYALLFVIGLINFQSLNLRTFLASIIGLITPYLFIISIFYLNDSISTLTTNIDYINNWNFILYNYS